MELIKNPIFVMIGEFKELKTRDDFKKELDDIDKKVGTNYRNFSKLPSVLISYEVGFKENESPVALGGYIEGGSVVRFGKTELKVISLPGHSPGGLAFYCEKEHCLFSGDSLFRGSIGRTDLEGGDMKSLYRSIVHRLFVLPDDVIVYPGHGEPTSIGYEKRNNPYFHMNDK